MPAPHPPGFYARSAEDVARDLLGDIVVSTVDGVRTSGRIVEAEAYIGPEDDASHAAARIGRTQRNGAMYGPPGLAYVYLIYGMYWCLNTVTTREDFPAAVLIRALEPLEGTETMRARRAGRSDRDLARGPGRLCQALGINGALNAHFLDREPLVILPGEPVRDIVATPRIGITRAADWPLRFIEAGSPWVSSAGTRPAPRRRR